MSRDERGFVAPEWAAAVGLLLFPVAFLVLSLPAWAERQGMARVAAQEAARAVALAADTGTGVAAGTALVDEIARNHGVDPAEVSVAYDGVVARGGQVRATVTVQLPAVVFPGLGSLGRVAWTAEHSELVDLYRGFGP